MINKSVFENDLIAGMQKELVKTAASENNSATAVDYLHSAMDILDDVGLSKHADSILNVLVKIAKKRKPKNPSKIPQPKNKHMTSKDFLKNLKHHGTMLADDGDVVEISSEDVPEVTLDDSADNLLNQNISTFEDEP